VKDTIAEDHLQLHGQNKSNGKEARSSGVGSGCWQELKEIVAKKNRGGKQLSRQGGSQAQLQTEFWSK